MFTGKGKLGALVYAHYPGIVPLNVEAFLRASRA